MAVTIKVAPEILQGKVSAITAQIDSIEKAIKKTKDFINSSQSYWEGDASNTHRKKFSDIEPELNKTVKLLKNHPRNLLQITGLYIKTESEQKAQAQSLPTDVIN